MRIQCYFQKTGSCKIIHVYFSEECCMSSEQYCTECPRISFGHSDPISGIHGAIHLLINSRFRVSYVDSNISNKIEPKFGFYLMYLKAKAKNGCVPISQFVAAHYMRKISTLF